MLYPPMSNLLEKVNSRYLLVNVVAKRSRELSEAAFERGESLGAKPVSVAINQLANGEYTAEHKGEY